MPNRIIKESVCTSEHIDMLTPVEEVTFYRLLVNCDDYGCFDGREKVLIARLYPLRDFKPADMRKTINRLAEVGLITLYTVNGKPYLCVNKWAEHQRVRVSVHKYPTPQEADETLPDDAETCGNSPQLAATRRNSPQSAADCRNLPPESESQSESQSESNIEVKRKQRFTPPTLDQVAEYCRERKNGVDPERFVDFYASKGWKVGNQTMRDWQACVRTWEKRDSTRPAGSAKQERPLAGNQFQQRDYSVEESFDDVLDRIAGGVA